MWFRLEVITCFQEDCRRVNCAPGLPAEFWVRVEEDLRKQNEAALLLFFLFVTSRHGADDPHIQYTAWSFPTYGLRPRYATLA